MKETEATDAGIGSVAFEDTDPADLLCVRLPVIQDHKADAVATSHKLLAEEDLLAFGATNVGYVFSPR
jgi:hypothetical protein